MTTRPGRSNFEDRMRGAHRRRARAGAASAPIRTRRGVSHARGRMDGKKEGSKSCSGATAPRHLLRLTSLGAGPLAVVPSHPANQPCTELTMRFVTQFSGNPTTLSSCTTCSCFLLDIVRKKCRPVNQHVYHLFSELIFTILDSKNDLVLNFCVLLTGHV